MSETVGDPPLFMRYPFYQHFGPWDVQPTYTSNAPLCAFCHGHHSGSCPKIKAIEYHANGQIKRIEYRDE